MNRWLTVQLFSVTRYSSSSPGMPATTRGPARSTRTNGIAFALFNRVRGGGAGRSPACSPQHLLHLVLRECLGNHPKTYVVCHPIPNCENRPRPRHSCLFMKILGQIVMGGKDLPWPDEGPHDLDVHLNRLPFQIG